VPWGALECGEFSWLPDKLSAFEEGRYCVELMPGAVEFSRLRSMRCFFLIFVNVIRPTLGINYSHIFFVIERSRVEMWVWKLAIHTDISRGLFGHSSPNAGIVPTDGWIPILSSKHHFRRICKISKNGYQLRHVCPCAMQQLGSHWSVFRGIFYVSVFRKSV
jgi:hypothetical protein